MRSMDCCIEPGSELLTASAISSGSASPLTCTCVVTCSVWRTLLPIALRHEGRLRRDARGAVLLPLRAVLVDAVNARNRMLLAGSPRLEVAPHPLQAAELLDGVDDASDGDTDRCSCSSDGQERSSGAGHDSNRTAGGRAQQREGRSQCSDAADDRTAGPQRADDFRDGDDLVEVVGNLLDHAERFRQSSSKLVYAVAARELIDDGNDAKRRRTQRSENLLTVRPVRVEFVEIFVSADENLANPGVSAHFSKIFSGSS